MLQNTNQTFKVTAVLSVYKAEKFIRGCLEDLVNQTLFKKHQLEIVIVNSDSPENEEAIIKEYLQKYNQIKYIKTEKREGIYKAWNRAIKVAEGKYVTNANADDRHREDALEILAKKLDENPEIDLVYSDLFLTQKENDIFYNSKDYREIVRPEFNLEMMLEGCHIGPQPMWRKSIHESVGYFNEEFTSAGDYEFWCRMVFLHDCKLKHISEKLGLYLRNENGIELGNWQLSNSETGLIVDSYKKYYLRKKIESNQKPVDIVLLTHNRLKYFHETVNSIYKHTRIPFRLIIVDNNSDESFVKYLKQVSILFDEIILNPVNEWTSAFQKGIDKTLSDPFVVSDPDILVPNLDDKCWLERLVDLHDKNPEMGLIALNLDPSNKPEKLPDVYLGEKEVYNSEIILSNVGTVMQAIKRDYFNFHYVTDWETCERIRRNGGKVGFAKNIIAYHLGWNEETDYPDYIIDKFKYFKEIFGVDTYKMYTTNENLIKKMDSSGDEYYEYPRPEVQELVNKNAKRILDVGCGSGVMAAELKQKLNAEVWGIEPVAKAAQRAKAKLDNVVVGTVENAIKELPNNYFDAITFADVLEHLVDPEKVIESIKEKLKPGGEIIASIPNIRHWTVIKKLIEGNWKYEDAGLLDKTHLRFFTIDTAGELFSKHRFNILDVKATVDTKFDYSPELMTALQNSGFNVSTLQEQSQYYQYLFKVQLVEQYDKTSIVIPIFNQLENTQITIESIFENTPENFELILIDNNSEKETAEYLKSIAESNDNIKLIRNEINRGFPQAVNQGLIEADGKYIVIANNDIVVNEGWLKSFIEAAESKTSTGIVSGISNEVSGVQKDTGANYQNIEEMKKYSELVKSKSNGQVLEFPRVAFLCTLIKKEVIEKIGGLDERFSPGNYEDDDFCLRSQVAGFKTVICKDVFIHHFGSKSFKADGNKKYDALLKKNRDVFIEKWGNDPDNIWLKGKDIKLREVEYPIDENEIHRFIKRASHNINNNEYELALKNLKDCILSFNEQNKIEEEELKLASVFNLVGKLLLKLEREEEAKYYFILSEEIENNIFENNEFVKKLTQFENELKNNNNGSDEHNKKKARIVTLPQSL